MTAFATVFLLLAYAHPAYNVVGALQFFWTLYMLIGMCGKTYPVLGKNEDDRTSSYFWTALVKLNTVIL